MTHSIIAGLLADSVEQVADPATRLGDLVIRNALLTFAIHEATIALVLSAGLFAVATGAAYLPSPEWGVLLACILVCAYALHVAAGLPPIWRYLLLVIRLRLAPRRVVRAALFAVVLAELQRLEGEINKWIHESPWYSRRPIQAVASWLSAPDAQWVWQVVLAIERRLWLHALRAFLLGLLPLLLLIITFRYTVTWGRLLSVSAHLSFLDAMVYPVAAICDALFGTTFRQFLLRP
jgi:hypothetical protein